MRAGIRPDARRAEPMIGLILPFVVSDLGGKLMTRPPLGKLERLDPRTHWAREDSEFTPWLAEEPNIQLLGETIGLELEVAEQEANVGPYRADILCRSPQDSSFVLIENQLEATDHTHLGQILTYASGLDAVTMVWITHHFTEEHRAALDWLNRITAEGFNFFGLEIELWRIGDSLAAPKFNVVAQPNDWRKAVRSTAGGGNTTAEKLRYQFWSALSEHMGVRSSRLRRIRPHTDSWVQWGIGRAGITKGASCSVRNKNVSVWLDLAGPSGKSWFRQLQAHREGIESKLGPLVWQEKPQHQASGITVRHGGDIADQACWPEIFDWILERLEAFDQVFRPLVKRLEEPDHEGPSLVLDDKT